MESFIPFVYFLKEVSSYYKRTGFIVRNLNELSGEIHDSSQSPRSESSVGAQELRVKRNPVRGHFQPFKCCGFSFPNSQLLKKHQNNQLHRSKTSTNLEKKDTSVFECCGFKFKFISQLKVHEQTYLHRGLVKCSRCRKPVTEEERKQHLEPVICCGFTLHHPAHLLKHWRSDLHKSKYHCTKCGKAFEDDDDYTSHHQDCTISVVKQLFCNMKNEQLKLKTIGNFGPNRRSFKCRRCGEFVASEEELREHQEPIICCGVPFHYPAHLLSHRRSFLHQSKFHCSKCGETFEEEEDLTIHHQNCTTSTRRYEFCCVGRKSSEIKVEREGHIEPVECCGIVFNYKSHLERHQKSSLHQNIFKCKICKEIFKNQNDYDLHREEKHYERGGKWICKICNEVFSYNGTLTRHMSNVHLVRSDYECSECPFKARFKDSVKRHFRDKHMDLPPQFFCDSCGRGFKKKDALATHIQKIHLKNRVQCSTCSRGFDDPLQLENHIKTHLPGKNFICQVCGKDFKTYRKREEHFATHTKVKVKVRRKALNKSFPQTKSRSLLAKYCQSLKKSPKVSNNGKPLKDVLSDEHSGFSLNDEPEERPDPQLELCSNAQYMMPQKNEMSHGMDHTGTDCSKTQNQSLTVKSNPDFDEGNVGSEIPSYGCTLNKIGVNSLCVENNVGAVESHWEEEESNGKEENGNMTHPPRSAICFTSSPGESPTDITGGIDSVYLVTPRNTIKEEGVQKDDNNQIDSEIDVEFTENGSLKSQNYFDVKINHQNSVLNAGDDFLDKDKEQENVRKQNSAEMKMLSHLTSSQPLLSGKKRKRKECTKKHALSHVAHKNSSKRVKTSKVWGKEPGSTLKSRGALVSQLGTDSSEKILQSLENMKITDSPVENKYQDQNVFGHELAIQSVSLVLDEPVGLTENINQNLNQKRSVKKRNVTCGQKKGYKRSAKSQNLVANSLNSGQESKKRKVIRRGVQMASLKPPLLDMTTNLPNNAQQIVTKVKGQDFFIQRIGPDDRDVCLLPEFVEEDFENHQVEEETARDEKMLEKVLSLDEFLFQRPSDANLNLMDSNLASTDMCLTPLVPVQPVQQWLP